MDFICSYSRVLIQKTLLFIICLSCISGLNAQANQANSLLSQSTVFQSSSSRACKTVADQSAIDHENSLDRAAYKKKLQFYLKGGGKKAIVQYTVQIHIVTQDDGTGGIDIAEIRSEFDNYINPYFAEIDVEFVECSPEIYHSSSEYYILGNGGEDAGVAGDAMSAAYNVADVINIYYVGDPDGACGWAKFPWNLPVDYIVIKNSCGDNQSTTVHELGHYFGLYHTHETAFGAESVTRDNSDGCWDCETAGDKLCDTPADPDLSDLANNFPSCAYTGNGTDACNGDSYVPDIDNIMCYADKECRTNFTAEQKARMEFYRDGDRSYLQQGCPCNKPEAICQDITINLDATGNAVIDLDDIDNGSTYDCGLDSWSISQSSFDCDDAGNRIVTLTIIDDIGWEITCQSIVTVVDVIFPELITPASDLTVECDGAGNISDFNNWLDNHGGAQATDECEVNWWNDSEGLSNGCGKTGSETVSFIAYDPSGNEVQSSATFTIEDTVKPLFDCPEDIHLPECIETAEWEIIASDICGDVDIVSIPPSGSIFEKGTTTLVSVTATDECGNISECTFEVTRDPDLEVDIDPLETSILNTCSAGTNANIILGYGNGPTCITMNAIGSGGHGPYTYAWTAPLGLPGDSFEDEDTASPTFCADFQTAPCVTYTFVVEVTDIHGCTEFDEVDINVVNPLCTSGNNPKVAVCHRSHQNPDNEHDICISSNAVAIHLHGFGHDDCLGGCEDVCVPFLPENLATNSTPRSNNLDSNELQVRPNPFNSQTQISFSVELNTEVRLTVFNLNGQVVATLFDGKAAEGQEYTLNFNASTLAEGMYIVQLISVDGINSYTPIMYTK